MAASEDQIRGWIREEIARTQTSVGTGSLVSRKRSLIQASARSVVINSALQGQLTSVPPQQAQNPPIARTTTAQPGPSRSIFGKRPSPGHPLRYTSKKKKKVKTQVVVKTVYLLDQSEFTEYTLTDSMILVKGECDFSSEYGF